MSAQKKKSEAPLAAGKSAVGATDGLAKVTLKVENTVTLGPNWLGTDTVMKVPPGSSVYHMLLQAYKDGVITFVASWNDQYWSHFISSINGLARVESKDANMYTYWSFEDEHGNVFDRGVDLISVYDGDVIKFRYVKY